jgi:hypothetical protein
MSFLGSCLSLLMACPGIGVVGDSFLTARVLVSLCPGGLLLNLRRRLFLWTQPFMEPISGLVLHPLGRSGLDGSWPWRWYVSWRSKVWRHGWRWRGLGYFRDDDRPGSKSGRNPELFSG